MAQCRVGVARPLKCREHLGGGVFLLAPGRVIHPEPTDSDPLDMPLADETGERGGYGAVREFPTQLPLDVAGAHRCARRPDNREDRSLQLTGLAPGCRTIGSWRLVLAAIS